MKTQQPKIDRYCYSPFYVSAENEDGRFLNTGDLIPVGDSADVLYNFAIQHNRSLLGEYQDRECDKLRSCREFTEGLFALPHCYVLFTTYYEDIVGDILFADWPKADHPQLPYTVVETFPRPLDESSAEYLAWVMKGY